MRNQFEKAEAARYAIRQLIGDEIQFDIGIVTGTGLGEVWKDMDVVQAIPYKDIPHFPTNTVKSHSGTLYIATTQGKNVLIFSGRFHYYEGYEAAEVAFPVRVAKLLGVDTILLTNVSGAVNPEYNQGDIIVVRDHINMLPSNPLRGHNDERFGPRFPDFKAVYDVDLRQTLVKTSQSLHIESKEGVYFAWQGPNLETPAEYTMIHRLGADLVGMSTVPEVIVAAHMGMKVAVLSVVSNVCYPVERIEETTQESVIAMAEKVMPKLNQLILHFIQEL